VPERFVTTHAAKHQHSWWAAEGKNSATGSFAARLLTYLFHYT
jgi:phage gp46-like protein